MLFNNNSVPHDAAEREEHMANYQNVKLEKSMYKSEVPFAVQLEKLDPSSNYAGSELAKLDAYERQLKRFDIKVSGKNSDMISKFFSTSSASALFPEYVSRAVLQGVDESAVIDGIIATKTVINGMDYRTICTTNTHDADAAQVSEGNNIPETVVGLKSNLVRLTKRGRMLSASYEAIKFQKIDLFSVLLKQIGNYISKAQLADAVDVLINGDGTGNNNAAEVVETAAKNVLTYEDLLTLWAKFDDFRMNTMIASPDMMLKLLGLPELRDANAGLNFVGSGMIGTPMGANVIRCDSVPAGTIIGLDKDYALEMVTAGDILVDYDKLIDVQLERAAVTSIAGFAKIFPQAAKVLKLKTV